MRRLCSICARGGSKGVPNKNLRTIGGIPLIGFSVIQAARSGLFTHIAVSSDSPEILAAANDYADIIPILRPATMATDTAPKLPVIQQCFTEVEKTTGIRFETAVDIDATSPLRSVDDLVAAVKLLESRSDADNLITAMPARRSPYFNLVEQQDDGYVQLSKKLSSSIIRRQDAPPSYDMNASIYVWERSKLLSAEKVVGAKTILYVMPEERSIDIDSALDFRIVEMLLLERMAEFKRVKPI